MSNLIQDKILALAPAATVKEGEVLTVTVRRRISTPWRRCCATTVRRSSIFWFA